MRPISGRAGSKPPSTVKKLTRRLGPLHRRVMRTASPENKRGNTIFGGPPCAASAVEKKRMLDDCRKTQSQQQAATSTP